MTQDRLIELLGELVPIFETHPSDVLTDVEIYQAIDTLTATEREKKYLKKFYQKKALESEGNGVTFYSVQ